jgi:hypothetical protein
MPRRLPYAAVAALIAAACVPLLFAAEEKSTEKPAEFDPTSAYRSQEILGWKVLVNQKLLEKDDLAKAVLTELEHQLYQVVRKVPPKAVDELKKVVFWVELADRDVVGMCYHPSREWLRDHGFNPEKAKSIELGNAKNFVAWSQQQPYMALHELAHSYHHQVLGYDFPAIKAAFKKAVESKSYEKVLNYEAKTVKHYALNNDQEYFAETSEAYFGTNDFYPFVRAELQQHDPEMYQVLKNVWKGPPENGVKTGGGQ